jgi:hypothetical protein
VQLQHDLIEAIDAGESTPRPRRQYRNKRGYQLAILEQMDLPRDLRAYGRPVKPAELKAMFHAIDNRARESGYYMLPIEDERDGEGKVVKRGLASESQLSPSQCKRCLKAAQDRGWIEKKIVPGKRGSDRCWWRIVFQELARTTTLPLWKDNPGPQGDDRGEIGATHEHPGITAERPPVTTGHPDHVPNWERPRAQLGTTTCPAGNDHVPGWERPRAHAGTQEAPINRKENATSSLTATESAKRGAPHSNSANGWAVVVEELRQKISIAPELAEQYAARGQTPDELRRDAEEAIATAELPQNARLWSKGPLAAAAFRLRTGRWPADGVLTLAEHQAAAERKQAAAARREAQEADEETRRACESRRLQELETTYGAYVDSLEKSEVRSLRKYLSPFAREYLARHPAPPWPPSLRLLLIEGLERELAEGRPTCISTPAEPTACDG